MRVTYRLGVGADEAEVRAEAIAREQTVEVPREVVEREASLMRDIVGRVERVTELDESTSEVTVAFPAATTKPGRMPPRVATVRISQ